MTQPNDLAPRYQSYLLRCWEVRSQQPNQPATWRFSLQDPQTEQKRGFADLDELVAFLQAEFGDTRERIDCGRERTHMNAGVEICSKRR
jgi:hypothetical protein